MRTIYVCYHKKYSHVDTLNYYSIRMWLFFLMGIIGITLSTYSTTLSYHIIIYYCDNVCSVRVPIVCELIHLSLEFTCSSPLRSQSEGERPRPLLLLAARAGGAAGAEGERSVRRLGLCALQFSHSRSGEVAGREGRGEGGREGDYSGEVGGGEGDFYLKLFNFYFFIT